MSNTIIEQVAPRSLDEASLTPRGKVHPSPTDWRDEILYFLLADRFSDGRERAENRPMFDRQDAEAHRAPDKAAWMKAGRDFAGGKLNGIRARLGYLKALGITAIWIAPVFKNRLDLPTYHGYSIQDFFEIDPRFGTRQELRDLVDEAHQQGIRVLFDIVYNHTGNNWFYANPSGDPANSLPFRREKHPFHSWRSESGGSTMTIQDTGDGVWPVELQNAGRYTRLGRILNFEPSPEFPVQANEQEFRLGDFGDQKDLDLSQDAVLSTMIAVYQYWIAVTDCDGFRIDTVKHLPLEASRNFCGAIREYCESIGKENFLLLGEVAGGGTLPLDYLEIFRANLDAVLDIGDAATRVETMAKGFAPPTDYFALYTATDALGSHRRLGRYHISVLDDHDMVNKGNFKYRFGSNGDFPAKFDQVALAVGIQLTTLGIPCIYYGTEQAFDGTQAAHDLSIEPLNADGVLEHNDRYVRECMFGGPFGAFETKGCHFFDTEHPVFLKISAVSRVRQRRDQIGLVLRRGRQYLRQIADDSAWRASGGGEVAAWSRVLFRTEVVIACNTHGGEARSAWIQIGQIAGKASTLQVHYRNDWPADALAGRSPSPEMNFPVSTHLNSPAVRVQIPAAGMLILASETL